VDATTTVFLGGSNDPYSIVTFDWTSMSYNKYGKKLVCFINKKCLYLKKWAALIIKEIYARASSCFHLCFCAGSVSGGVL
jgi:hypothetical protein